MKPTAAQALWHFIHNEELAGHFPHQMLQDFYLTLFPVRCSKCGGPNVHVAMWCNLNTGAIINDYGEWQEADTKFCEDCEEHVPLLMGDEEYEPPDTKPKDLWENNEVQFARLLEEIVAAGFLALDPLMCADMCASMDLSAEQVESLLNRARLVWLVAQATVTEVPQED